MLKKIQLTSISIIAFIYSNSALSAIIDFEFNATVTYSYNGSFAHKGTQFIGNFSYDTDFSYQSPYGYAEYLLPSPFNLTANVNGHSIETNNSEIRIQDNFGGNVEDHISIAGYSVAVGDTLYKDGHFGFSLASRYGNTDVLTNTFLPESFDITQFDHPSFQTGGLYMHGNPGGQLLGFTIDSINNVTPVPLPPTILLMISGLLILKLFSNKKTHA